MMTKIDLNLIKYFKAKILNLKYGRTIKYQLEDTGELAKDHLISIHKLDENNFIVKLVYKVSAESLKNI